jgi:hypothetical protein
MYLDLGYNNLLNISGSVNASNEYSQMSINNANIDSIMEASAISLSKTTLSKLIGKESVESENYVSGTSGWIIMADGTAQFKDITLIGGTISYGKTSFSDSTNAGYYISSAGIYFGSASDATKMKYTLADGSLILIGSITATSGSFTGGVTIGASGSLSYGKTSFSDSTNAGYYISASGIYFGAAGDVSLLKYTIADGSFDFIGTVSSRSTVTIANAINTDGDLVQDVINEKIDTSAKEILSDFNFGTDDYAGAVKSGDIAWNATTGAVESGSGVVVYRKGIVGATNGVATFTLDATTGSAVFSGTLSAASGTLGALTVAASGYIMGGQTDFATGTGWFIGSSGGTYKFSIGDANNYITWDGSYLRIKGNIEFSSVFTNISYTVANLPIPASSVGFNSPSGTE